MSIGASLAKPCRERPRRLPTSIGSQEENSFYLPRDESPALRPAHWQDAAHYLQDVNFEEDDSFRNMAQHTY